MKSCISCKYAEETLIGDKVCTNNESEYCTEFVNEKDLCKEWLGWQ